MKKKKRRNKKKNKSREGNAGSLWPQSGGDVQDNRMLKFCRFFSPFNASWASFHPHASTVNLSERVKYDPGTWPHPRLFFWCSDVYQLNLQLTRDWRRNALRLRIKGEMTLAGEHWLSQSFQNNYSPMCPRLFLRCLETPKPDAEIDVVFGFLLKVGHTRLRLVMTCTLKLHTVPLFGLFNFVSCCSLATEYLWQGDICRLEKAD